VVPDLRPSGRGRQRDGGVAMYWTCEKCGAQGILSVLDVCPNCHKPREDGSVTVTNKAAPEE
jgi:rubrerythrin